jgi:hypothetical protein
MLSAGLYFVRDLIADEPYGAAAGPMS